MKTFFILLILMGLAAGRAGAAAVDINYQLGLDNLNQKQYQQSALYLEKALKRDKKNPSIYEMLGESYSGLGQGDRAVKAFIKCLDLDPGNAKAAKLLNGLLVEKQNPVAGNEKKEAPEKANKIEFRMSYGYPSWPGPSPNIFPWNEGQSLGVWLGYDFNSQIALGARLSYDWYTANPQYFATQFFPSGVSSAYTSYTLDNNGMVEVVQIVPTFKLSFVFDEKRLAPYLFTGAGLMNQSMKTTTVNGVSSTGTTEIGSYPGYSRNTFIGLIGMGLPFPIAPDVEVAVEIQKIFGFSDSIPLSFDSADIGLLFRL